MAKQEAAWQGKCAQRPAGRQRTQAVRAAPVGSAGRVRRSLLRAR